MPPGGRFVVAPVLEELEPRTQRRGSAVNSGTPATTALLTPEGWSTFGAIRAGDTVVGSWGAPTTVTDVFRCGVRPTARVMFADRSHVLVGADHPWPVRLGGAAPEVMKMMHVSKMLDMGVEAWAPVPHPVAFLPWRSRHGQPLTPLEAARLGEAYQEFDEPTYRRLLEGLGCDLSLANDWRIPAEVLFGDLRVRVSFTRSLGESGAIESLLHSLDDQREPARDLTRLFRSLGAGSAQGRIRFPEAVWLLISSPCFDAAAVDAACGRAAAEQRMSAECVQIVAVVPDSPRELVGIAVEADDGLCVVDNFVLTGTITDEGA